MYWMIHTRRTLFVALCTCYWITAQGCSQKRTDPKGDVVTNANFAEPDRSISLEETLEKAGLPGIAEGSGEPSDYVCAVKEATDNTVLENKRDHRARFSAVEPGIFTAEMEERRQQLKERGPRSAADVARDFDQMIQEDGPYSRLVRADN